jgi:hypothetical protein
LYSDKAGEILYKKFIRDEAARGSRDRILALVTGMPDSNASKAVYKVIAWTGPVLSDRDRKTLIDIANLKLEVAFVIDTTNSTESIITSLKGVASQTATELTMNYGKEIQNAVRFGLVEYRDDSPSKKAFDVLVGDDAVPMFGARVALPLTPGDSIQAFIDACDRLQPEESGMDDKPEDILAGLNLAITKKDLGWSDASVKHVILMGDACGKVGTIEPKPAYGMPFVTRDTGAERFDSATGLTIKSFLNKAHPTAGSDFQRALQARTIHTVYGRIKYELEQAADEIKEDNKDLAEALLDKDYRTMVLSEDPSPNGVVNEAAVLRLVDKTGIENIKVLAIVSNIVFRYGADILIRQDGESQWSELANNNNKRDGINLTFSPEDGDDVNATAKKIADQLAVAYKALEAARKNELAELKGEGGIKQSFWEVVNNQKDLKKKSDQAEVQYARSSNDSGRVVADEQIMVYKKELLLLAETFKGLYGTFEDKSSKQDRQNVKDILDELKKALAGNVTGDKLDEVTNIDEVIKLDIPIQTPALRVSAKRIGAMTTATFSNWLSQLDIAADTSTKLSGLPTGSWNRLGSGVDGDLDGNKLLYTFIDVSDLP